VGKSGDSGQAGGHANYSFLPTRLSPLDIGGHSRFQDILWGVLSRTRRASEAWSLGPTPVVLVIDALGAQASRDNFLVQKNIMGIWIVEQQAEVRVRR